METKQVCIDWVVDGNLHTGKAPNKCFQLFKAIQRKQLTFLNLISKKLIGHFEMITHLTRLDMAAKNLHWAIPSNDMHFFEGPPSLLDHRVFSDPR